jgi:hypothetical protein
MKPRVSLPALFVVVMVLAACAPPPELRDSALLRDTSLIDSEPCAAPCWRGITPGQTAWRDALTLIEDDASLQDMQIQEDDDSTAIVASFRQADGAECCQLFSQGGEFVDLIFLRLAPTTTLGQLIEAQGEPAFLVGNGFSDDQAIMNILYPDLNLVIYAFVAGEAEGVLSANSEVIGALYMKPEEMQLLLQTSSLQAWEGYESYRFYAESTLEITPSVTLTPTPTPGA